MNSKNKGIAIIVLIVLVLLKGYLFSVKYDSNEEEKEYTVFIENIKSVTDTKISYNVKLLNSRDKFILNIYNDYYNNVKKDLNQYAKYQYGDVLKVKGKISVPQLLKNPGEFNYKQYLYSNNIYGLINTYDIPQQISYNLNLLEKIYKKVSTFKRYVKKNILDNMEDVNANLAISMIYGDRDNLEDKIQEDFKNLGVSHLMSVSGTHITSFVLVINFILGNVNRGKKAKNKKTNNNKKTTYIIKKIIQIMCIWLYIIFAGLSVSVLRAGIMITVSIACEMFEIKKNKYIAMTIALLLLILHTPFVIFNVGFQLSFLATLGIIVFNKYLSYGFIKITDKIKNKYIKKIVNYILNSITITIVVQLIIIPIQIQSFNKLYFPIIIPNLILGIISIPIRLLGIIGIMLLFAPNIAGIVFKVVQWLVILLIKVVEFLKLISLNISIASQPLIFFVIYYLALLFLVIYLKLRKNAKYKEGKYNIKNLLRYLKLIIISLSIISIILLTCVNIYSIYYSEYIYFFNVEQGEMSYVKSGKNSIIVDAGSMKKGLSFNTISNFFKKYNLKKVDAIILSHLHSDHVNGLEGILKEYSVEKVIYTKPKKIDKNYNDFIGTLKKYNIDIVEVKQKDKLKFGNIKVNVLLPDDEYIKEDEENENSLICEVEVKDKKILYMGDASKNAEKKLINEKFKISNIDILKVGHHGSKTATTENFIKKIKPKYAVISASKKYYGHPHESTLNVLKLYNVQIYLTQINGAIKFNI